MEHCGACRYFNLNIVALFHPSFSKSMLGKWCCFMTEKNSFLPQNKTPNIYQIKGLPVYNAIAKDCEWKCCIIKYIICIH